MGGRRLDRGDGADRDGADCFGGAAVVEPVVAAVAASRFFFLNAPRAPVRRPAGDRAESATCPRRKLPRLPRCVRAQRGAHRVRTPRASTAEIDGGNRKGVSRAHSEAAGAARAERGAEPQVGSRGLDPKVDKQSRSAGQSFLNRGVFKTMVLSKSLCPNLETHSIQMGAPRSFRVSILCLSI